MRSCRRIIGGHGVRRSIRCRWVSRCLGENVHFHRVGKIWQTFTGEKMATHAVTVSQLRIILYLGVYIVVP